MSKIIHRKFPFFDIEEGNKEMNSDKNDLKPYIPKELKSCEDFIFISAKDGNKDKILKLNKNTKLGEFECFTHSIDKFLNKKKRHRKKFRKDFYLYLV